MQIGNYEATECEKPTGKLAGVRHMDTEHGPVDFFADVHDQVLYMRHWRNRDGMNEIIWYRLEKEL